MNQFEITYYYGPSAEFICNPDYMSHLEAFANIVGPDVLSYDHYHFRGCDVDENCIYFRGFQGRYSNHARCR